MTDAPSQHDGLPFPRSACPITATLDLIGDRWSLILIRDLLMGKRHYGDFLASPEGISTNILADRLKRLERDGLAVKRPYQANPLRYEYHLTEKGRALQPVLREICLWAQAHMPGTITPPPVFLEPPAQSDRAP
jgi:DNA-binding HxlR family transcriptional regulator